MHLALRAGINRYNNNIYFSGNDYGNNKELIENRSFKFHKNKLVLWSKVNISHNNSTNNDDDKDLSSKSFENCKINKILNNTIENMGREKINGNAKVNNRYCIIPEKNKEKDTNYNNPTKEKKFKNIVLRPHKIPKEKQLSNIINFEGTELKNNIKVNKYKKGENSPEIIKNITEKFYIKPKHSRVFKYK